MMIVNFKKSFLNDLARLPPDVKLTIEELVFNKLTEEDLDKLQQVEKMKGYPGKYQLRMGNLRFGFTVNFEKREILCERIAHRKDIYKLFP
jgi:mRNA interferase RelE/StbE